MRLDLKVGFSCNNKCVFCVQGDKRDRYDDRPFDEICDILASNVERTGHVVLTGGEATVRKDIVEIVAKARELGYTDIQLQTNGRRLSYAPFVAAMMEAGMTEVAPALHGSNPAIHDALTRAPGAWMQVVRGIRNCRKAGLPVIMNSVIVQQNYRDLPQLARLLCDLDVTQMQFAMVHPAGTAERYFERVVPRFSDAGPHVHAALQVARDRGVRAFAEAMPFCFMRGYELEVAEPGIPDTTIFDAELTIDDYTAYRLGEGKAKGPPCAGCSFDAVCEGPWHEYPEEMGWDEFEPRADDPAAFFG